MSNSVTPFRPSQAAVVYSGKQLDLIRKTVAAGCEPDEFNLFIEIARRAGLDPFRKQLYAIVYGKGEKRKMAIVTGIDGYRAIAARCGDYRPAEDAPTIETDATLRSPLNPAGIVSATVKCWKQSRDGQWHAVAGTSYWDETAPLKEIWEDNRPSGKFRIDPTSNWFKMPRLMLAKCAEAQALRRGWPEDLSGIYSEEEFDRARAADVSATEAANEFEQQQTQARIGSKDAVFVQWSQAEPLEAVPLGQFADRAAAFVKAITALPDLHGWRDTNRAALQDFWARSKADALELKKLIEAREREITGTGNQ